MKRTSSFLPVLASVVAASLVCGTFRFLVDRDEPGDRDGTLAAALGRIERRLADVEHQVHLAAAGHAEPAEVTRVAEERGIGVDDAWNEYFDGIVSRLDRIERRLDGGETPAPVVALPEGTLLTQANAYANYWGAVNQGVYDVGSGFVRLDANGDGNVEIVRSSATALLSFDAQSADENANRQASRSAVEWLLSTAQSDTSLLRSQRSRFIHLGGGRYREATPEESAKPDPNAPAQDDASSPSKDDANAPAGVEIILPEIENH
jgi:hypothetical protein